MKTKPTKIKFYTKDDKPVFFKAINTTPSPSMKTEKKARRHCWFCNDDLWNDGKHLCDTCRCHKKRRELLNKAIHFFKKR